MKILLLLLLSVMSFTRADDASVRLYKDLLDKYERLARPVRNSSCALKILFKLKLTSLADVFEKNQVVTVNGYLLHTWHDYRLMWRPEDYGGVRMVHIPTNLIWLPDIILYNNAAGKPQVTTMTKAAVYYSGQVHWEPPVIYSFLCAISIEWFPYDDQYCQLKFGSWTYYGNHVDLIQPITDKVVEENYFNEKTGKNESAWMVEVGADISEYQESGEWDLMSVSSHRNVRWYPCCDYPYIDITYKMHIRRKTLFYTVNLVTPCVGITFMTCLVFYLPSDSNNKISLCVSILVTLTVFFLLLVETIPPTSLTIPLIGRYLLFTMSMTTLSICCTIAVLNVHHRTSQKPIPRWVRWIFIDILPKVLWIHRPVRYNELDVKFKQLKQQMTTKVVMARAAPVLLKDESSSVERRDPGTQLLLGYLKKACENVNYIADHLRRQRKERMLRDDWKFAAIVADRVLLYVFTVVVFFGTHTLLTSAPSLSDKTVPITQQNFSDAIEELHGLNKTIDINNECYYELLMSFIHR